jgi:adenylate kinase
MIVLYHYYYYWIVFSVMVASAFQQPSAFTLRNLQTYHSPTTSRRTPPPNFTTCLDRQRHGPNSLFTTTITPLYANTALDEHQIDFAMGYLNKHHSSLIIEFVTAFTDVGVTQAQKNAFSGGSYIIQAAKITDIHHSTTSSQQYLTLEATIQIRGAKQNNTVKIVQVDLNSEPLIRGYDTNVPIVPKATKDTNPMDDFVRRLSRLAIISKQPQATGKFVQLSFQLGGSKIGLLKEDMFLNQVPHNKYVRQYFYDMASDAVFQAVSACSDKKISNRMKMTALFPEVNPSMDSYRIGTLLELARAIAIRLAEENLRVRVCVQGSMGVGIFTGIPKQLSGASVLLQRMDWQSGPGEVNEGMVGNYVNFGGVGKDHVVNQSVDSEGNVVVPQDDVFLILCPQSMVGQETSIIGPLQEMVQATGDRPVILINPDLSDKVSAQGQQNIRGRRDRMEFADSFQSIFHFQNIYVSGTSYFPILGAIFKANWKEPWISYQRRDTVDGGEIYVPVLQTEEKADGTLILDTFE